MTKRILFLFLILIICTSARKHSDVEKIGNRDINGRIARVFPNLVSLEREIAIGGEYARQFEQTAKLVEDSMIVEYVNRIGQDIVKHSDAKVLFTIKVLDTDEVNAFALPGGYFYVNKGLIAVAESESELVGVMAHEIAHVAARHATERMTKAQLMQFAALPVLFVGGYWAQYGIRNVLGIGMSLAVLGITRQSEEEADQLGVQYVWNSGYDPNGYVGFFERLKLKEKEKPGTFTGFFRTHPTVENRIEKVQEEMKLLPPHEEYKVTTSDFERVKNRLIQLDNKLVAPGQSLGGKPTLKRKTNSDRKESTRPTLKKDKN